MSDSEESSEDIKDTPVIWIKENDDPLHDSFFYQLQNSSDQLRIIQFDKDGEDFLEFTKEIEKRGIVFPNLKLVDLTECGNMADDNIHKSMIYWLFTCQMPYIKFNHGGRSIRKLYQYLLDEGMLSFMIKALFRRLIICNRNYLVLAKDTKLYLDLVEKNILSENWIEIHEDFFNLKWFRHYIKIKKDKKQTENMGCSIDSINNLNFFGYSMGLYSSYKSLRYHSWSEIDFD